jgi:hypothetical protein
MLSGSQCQDTVSTNTLVNFLRQERTLTPDITTDPNPRSSPQTRRLCRHRALLTKSFSNLLDPVFTHGRESTNAPYSDIITL